MNKVHKLGFSGFKQVSQPPSTLYDLKPPDLRLLCTLFSGDMPLFRPENTIQSLLRLVAKPQQHSVNKLQWTRYLSNEKSVNPPPKVGASDPPGPGPDNTSMIGQENASQGMIKHQPNYNAPVDHGTS